MEQFTRLIESAVREGYSDIHITGAHPVVYRKNGVILFDRSLRWTHQQVDELVRGMLNARQLSTLKTRWSVDLATSVQHIRLRLNVFNTTRGLSLAIRMLPGIVPTVQSLNLHPCLGDIARNTRSGLLAICGSTGSGKSTTIAAVVDEINRTRAAHIITLEDPVEFRFVSSKSFVEQRELGAHMSSFEQGLRDVLREGPDVIVVGELREPETMTLALDAAEAGHLVIASLHASNSEDAIYRLCSASNQEGQEVVRTKTASALSWVLVQQLELVERVGFRVPVLSILRITTAVRQMIRENRLTQLENAIQIGRNEGMWSMDSYRREFLARQLRFTPPWENFRPSEEASPEVVYQSPLIDPAAVPSVVRHPRGNTPLEVGGRNVVMEDGSDYYLIEEDMRVDELIDQITRSGKYGDE